MIRLVDEIITNSSYLDSANVELVEYVGISPDALTQISKEVGNELDKQRVSNDDIESALTLKYLLMPNLRGIDYKFFREIPFR